MNWHSTYFLLHVGSLSYKTLKTGLKKINWTFFQRVQKKKTRGDLMVFINIPEILVPELGAISWEHRALLTAQIPSQSLLCSWNITFVIKKKKTTFFWRGWGDSDRKKEYTSGHWFIPQMPEIGASSCSSIQDFHVGARTHGEPSSPLWILVGGYHTLELQCRTHTS